jgi:hypothetical protein
MQMPTQRLLRSTPLVDEIIAVVNEQLQITENLLAWTRPPSSGSRSAARATASASIGSDFPRARPARRSGAISFGGTRNQILAEPEQQPLEPARQLPAILHRPQPLDGKPCRPPTSSSLPTGIVVSSSIRPAPSTATAVTDCLCTSTPITIIYLASSTAWGRPASGQTSIEAKATLLICPTARAQALGGLCA